MKVYLRSKSEPSVKAWVLRVAMGPAMILDGLIHVCTLTLVGTSFALECARRLAWERHVAEKG